MSVLDVDIKQIIEVILLNRKKICKATEDDVSIESMKEYYGFENTPKSLQNHSKSLQKHSK